MKADAGRVVLFVLGAALINACGEDQLQKRELPPAPQAEITPPREDSQSPGPSACDRVAQIDGACPELSCPSEEVGECLLTRQADTAQWCAITDENDACVAGEPSTAYEAYCRVQECYGENYDSCIAAAGCEPLPPGVCEQIEAIAGGCPGYDYNCPAYPVEQSECYLDLLELMVSEAGGVCFMFDAADARCSGGSVTIEGFSSCATQECFGVTTYESCMGNLELICSFGG